MLMMSVLSDDDFLTHPVGSCVIFKRSESIQIQNIKKTTRERGILLIQ